MAENTPRFGTIPGVWYRTDSPLNAGERYVLSLIALHASRDAHECYPTQERIAEIGQIVRETVNRAIQGLVKKGAVQIIRRLKDNIPVYRVLGYEINQSVELPWDPGGSDLKSQAGCEPVVTGTEIGSTTYSAGSDLNSQKQYLTKEQGQNHVAAPELKTAKRPRPPQENYNPPTEMPLESEIVGPDTIKELGQNWRRAVGPPIAP